MTISLMLFIMISMSMRKAKTAKVARVPRQNRGRKAASNKPTSQRMIPHPPELDHYEITHSQWLRFKANAPVNQNITFQNLLDTILLGNGAGNTPNDAFHFVKIKRVRCWSLPAIGSENDLTIIFNGITAGIVGDQDFHQDTSMGIEPAYLDIRPSKKSQASQFQTSSTATAFSLNCQTGTVIDVQLQFRNIPGVNVGAQNAEVLGTLGQIVYRGLDGKAIATSSLLPPVGVPQV